MCLLPPPKEHELGCVLWSCSPWWKASFCPLPPGWSCCSHLTWGSVSFQNSGLLGSQGPSAATCASSAPYLLPPWWPVQAFCFTSVSPQEKRGDSPAHVTSRKGLLQQLGDNCDSSCGSAPSMHISRSPLIRRRDWGLVGSCQEWLWGQLPAPPGNSILSDLHPPPVQRVIPNSFHCCPGGHSSSGGWRPRSIPLTHQARFWRLATCRSRQLTPTTGTPSSTPGQVLGLSPPPSP